MVRWLALALLSGTPLAAQPPAPNQTITVTGERPQDRDQIHREAHDFVESHAVETQIGQYARWHDPICVRTWGLPLQLNAAISNKVMDIAERLGVPTNRADLCSPNVRIGFTSEPQTLIERAARRNPAIIGFHYASQGRELRRVRLPVQAWYVTATRAGTGGSGGQETTPHQVIDQAGVRVPGGGTASRITSGISSVLAHVLIFADARVAAGEDVDAMAELFAFLALAQTPVAETCDDADTVLNLMNPACPATRRPVALTRQDVAYLHALYRVDPEARPVMQRGALVGQMTNALEGRR
jgi:hypothetical protein